MAFIFSIMSQKYNFWIWHKHIR